MSARYRRLQGPQAQERSMRPALRRPLLLLGLLAASFITFVHFRMSILPVGVLHYNAAHTCPSTPPAEVYKATPARGRFDWSKVPFNYPKDDILQLPREEPSPLPRIQHAFGPESSKARDQREYRKGAVKAVFEKAWDSYKARAWLADELTPVSGRSKETYGGWAATLMDNLDTLYIMGLHDEFETAVKAVTKIDFAPREAVRGVNIFETTIRHLGGLLSAYDLTHCQDTRLLDKALEVGEMLLHAYDTPNGMPITRFDPNKAAAGGAQAASSNAVLAELGSASLEFTRLSQLTGDMRFYNVVQRFTDMFDEQQNRTRLPGLFPFDVDTRRMDVTAGWSFSLGAMADSAYEYFGKMYALLGGTPSAAQYEKIYRDAMDAFIKHMLYRPMIPDEADILLPGIAHVDHSGNVTLEAATQHLMCFTGGMLALGGRLFANDTHIDIGRKITEGCAWVYKHSPLGIMPEAFHMIACPQEDGSNAKCAWDEASWARQKHMGHFPKGYRSIEDPAYRLRPEAIESIFYLYRITGDSKYQDMAWEMFDAIEFATATRFANAAIKDVLADPPVLLDSMESFWLAETLKYFYLVFSEVGVVRLDEFVFNTEAHPLRRLVVRGGGAFDTHS